VSVMQLIHSQAILVEFGHSSLKVLVGDKTAELPVERLENGRLTPASRDRLKLGLAGFIKHKDWQAHATAFCAIGGRGVSLRKLSLPSATKKELHKLLLLQIESEFPLPPEEMAWGYRSLNHVERQGNGAPVNQDLIVAAVKKEVVEEYTEILAGSGLSPVFTLGSLARNLLCPQPPGFYAILDIGRIQSELMSFENGVPSAIRILPWGGENVTQAIARRLGVSTEEAETLKLQSTQEFGANGEVGKQVQYAIREELEAMAGSLHSNWVGQKLYLAGKSSQFKEIAPWISQFFGGGVACERLDAPAGDGHSATLLALKNCCGKDGDGPPLTLQISRADGGESTAQPAHWKWAALAVLLAFGSFSLRYAEAYLQKPRLAKKLTELRSYRDKLPAIDRELNFLEYLRTNQPPYLDAILAIAKAAPQGTHVDSLSMNRCGEISLKGSLQNGPQAVDFRTNMIASDFFSFVGVEDQSPTPDRQKMNVRMSAQWKSALEREALAKAKESGKAASGKPEGRGKEASAGPPEITGKAAPQPAQGNPPTVARKD
jgi:hypothetical protein